MSDLVELLSRTTPDLEPVDVERVAATARRRNRRRRLVISTPAVVVTVALLALAAQVDRGGSRELVLTSPDGSELAEPVGRWRKMTAPPLAPRSDAYSATMDDGRLLVWGGGQFRDGAIYDAGADSWTRIPEAPLPPEVLGLETRTQLAGQRLLVIAVGEDGRVHGAMYDIGHGRWTSLPRQDEIRALIDGVGWTGEVVALVRLDPGGPERLGDAPNGFQIGKPTTLRWSPGEAQWTHGAAPPLRMRTTAGAAFDGRRLAIWGGSTRNRWTEDPPPGKDDTSLADGAIYDIPDDRWTTLPQGPLEPRNNPSVSWQDGRLYVGGGQDTFYNPDEVLASAAAYDPRSSRWSPLPPPPTAGAGGHRGRPGNYWPHDDRRFWVRESLAGADGPGVARWFLSGDRWEQAPLPDLHHWGEVVLATSTSTHNPGDGRFDVRIRAGAGSWLRTAEAPFVNRMDPVVAVMGDRLVVVLGSEGSRIQDQASGWVLDLKLS